jgi:AcrR family transcriptional regulator
MTSQSFGSRGEPDAAAASPGSAKERILRATAELIAEVGWGGVRTRAVAERAGVNVALVHYHFGSMEALLQQAAMASLTEAVAEPTVVVLGAPSLARAWSGIVDWIGRVDQTSTHFRVMVEVFVRATYDPEVRAWVGAALDEFRRVLAELVRRARSVGQTPPDLDPQAAAVLLAALLDGLLLHRLVDSGLDLEGARHALEALLSQGTSGRAAAGGRRTEQASARGSPEGRGQ